MSDAFDDLARPGMRQRLARMVGRARPQNDPADIEDAIQDVLVKVYEAVAQKGSMPAPDNWDAYMRRAVENRLNDFHRSKTRDTARRDALSDLSATSQESPEQQLELIERSSLFAALMRCIAGEQHALDDENLCAVFVAVQRDLAERLSDKQWLLLKLRGVGGMGITDCAAAMGVSTGSVHGWYKSALQICAQTLRKHGLDTGEVL